LCCLPPIIQGGGETQKPNYLRNQNHFIMKQVLVIACLVVAAAGCNHEDKTKATSEAGDTKTAAAADVKLPFPLDRPYRGWQIMENNDNTIAAMNSLKAFVDKDFAAVAASFGDSIQIRLDGYVAKLSRDSAAKMLTNERLKYKEITITMYDYESVISADKKDEYVTLWYKQGWVDNNGKADSMNIVDDCKMQNGKMIELDEKIQRFPAKK